MQRAARYIAVLWMMAISILCQAQSSAPTLTELIESAIQNDYTLMNQKLDINQSELDKQQLKDAFLPRLKIGASESFALTTLSLRTNEIEIPNLNIKIARATNRFTLTSDQLKAGADASLLLYSGGRIPWLKKSVEEKIKAQSLLTEKQKQDIISNVIGTYDQLALLRQARVVLEESKRRLAEHLRIADKSFTYGLITKYEREKIEVAQAQLASQITDYDGKLVIVLERLFLLTHIPVERLILINNNLELIQNNLADLSIVNRPDLKASGAIIIAQEFKIKAEKTWRIPKVQAQGSLGYFGSYFGHLKSSKPVLPNSGKLSVDLRTLQIVPAVNIGIGLSWDIFDGNDGRRDIARAKLDLQKAENNKADLIQNLELNLSKNRTDYEVSITQVTLRGKQVKISRNALDQAIKEYRTGLIRTSELIDAEEDMQQADLRLLQAIYDQRRAAIELLKATGNLNIQSLQ